MFNNVSLDFRNMSLGNKSAKCTFLVPAPLAPESVFRGLKYRHVPGSPKGNMQLNHVTNIGTVYIWLYALQDVCLGRLDLYF